MAAQPGSRPGRPARHPTTQRLPTCPALPRWHTQSPDDWELSLEEDPETTERRRAAWPCSRLLDLLGPEARRIGC